MEVKKSPKADLEGGKSTNILIGVVLVFALMFVAFEWTQRDFKVVETEEPIFAITDQEIIPISHQEEKLTPPPAAAPAVAEVINIVDDKTELTEETVQTTEENNQAIVVGTGHADGPPVEGPVGPVEEGVGEGEIFQVVEAMPQFPGGMDECIKWLGKNIKYPPSCEDESIQGNVICQFVVNKDGSIVDVAVLRTPAGGQELGREAERVIKKMPKWQPGRQRGKPVRVKFTLPVQFRIQ